MRLAEAGYEKGRTGVSGTALRMVSGREVPPTKPLSL